MRLKRTISAILVIALLVSQFYGLGFALPKVVYAENLTDARIAATNNIANKYFYNQLTDEAKIFYDGMDKLLLENDYSQIKSKLAEPDSKFGVDSYDLTEKFKEDGNVLEKSLYTKLEAYTKGNQELLNLMATARDAWMADHAGAFYVDSSNITLRVTKDGAQKLHVFMGIGRTDTYINKTFWDSESKKVKTTELIEALTKVEEEKNKIVEEVKAVESNLQAGQSLEEQQARKAHDMIVLQNSYKLEETIIEEGEGDPFSVRNVYGAFVTHEIVCEGFARAFKMVMDDVNIPCVLVYGAFTSATQYEEHMWNYIQFEDGKWYGVDLTWDNTDEIEDQGYAGMNERISTEYFAAGSDKMDMNHLVTGTMSAAKYEFKYPELEKSSDRYVTAYENAGLKVEIDTESYDEEDSIAASKLKVSYAVDLNENGVIDAGERMGYNEAVKHGYYLVSKFLAYKSSKVEEADPSSPQYNQSEESWGGTSYYAYILPDVYGSIQDFQEDNGDSYTSFYNANSQFMQFGVTDVKPLPFEDAKTPADLTKCTTFTGASSDLLAVSDMIFNPNGTYIAAPYIKRATPVLNSTMSIGSTYHCEVEYDDILIPAEGKQPSDIGLNVEIEYSSNVDRNTYTITDFKFDGKSTFTFDFTPSTQYADDAIYYNITFTNVIGQTSGKPPMVVNWFCAHPCEAYAYKSQGFDWNVYGKPTLMDDVNLDELTDQENEELSELLKHRLTLVTTSTKPSEEAAMEQLLEAGKDKDGEDLNIGGTVEKTETYNISLTLCKKQKIENGQRVRIMLGFPAGYGPDDAGVTFKAYHYIKDASGRITGVEEIPCMITELGLIIECDAFSPFTIAAIDTGTEAKVVSSNRTVLFQSNEGGDIYIEDEKANSVVLDESENSEVTLTIKPEKGYVVDDIVIGDQVIDLNGEDVTESDGNDKTYTIKYSDIKKQEYDALVAKVAFIPEVTKQEEKESGFEVVAQPLVAQPEFELATTATKVVTTKEQEESTELTSTYNKDDIIEVTYSLTGMTNVDKDGVKKVKGTLKYNKENLQYVGESIKAGKGWKNFTASDSEGTLTISGEDETTDKSSQIGEVFKLRFKVLNDVDSVETLVFSEIKGDDGEDENVPVCSDVVTTIQLAKKAADVEDEITITDSSSYVIEDNMIIGVDPKSTINDLAKDLQASGNKLITFYGTKLELDEYGNVSTNDVNELLKVSTKLTGQDIIATGTTARVGSKNYAIIISGDVDGDGDSDMVDLSLILSSYREIEQLTGYYNEAGDVDEDGVVDMIDVSNVINYYRGIQDSPKPDAE